MMLRLLSPLRRACCAAAALLIALQAAAQSAPGSSSREDAPRVFIDCQFGCDLQYVKNEVSFVNFVRDRRQAQVYVLLTLIETGGGGGQFTLFFIGQETFEGQADTLVYNAPAASTEGIVREALLGLLKRGLLPYLLQTPLAERLTYSLDGGDGNAALQPDQVRDPWHNWVFSARLNFSADGQESNRSLDVSSFLRAAQVLPAYKVNASAYFSRSASQFFVDQDTFVNLQRSWGANLLYVKSLGQHWSAGLFADYNSSLFQNIRGGYTLLPALEYDLYPYEEATRRQLRFLYRIGPRFNQYVQETVYGFEEELRFRQHLEIGFEQVEPWGSISIELDASHYFHDVNLHNLSINPEIEWNLFKGFNLNFNAYAELSRDQIFLTKGDATPEEVLLQIRQLKTGYFYFLYGGISYTFGSIYNNVVNPRFGR
ncbi:MAG: hypothetical protein NW241_16355 [Bacteroidia bacterium]|nr:hypothetical protein [Bacteroidia bacterium]